MSSVVDRAFQRYQGSVEQNESQISAPENSSPVIQRASQRMQEPKKSPVQQMKTELAGTGLELVGSVAGIPRRFLEFINLAPKLTQRYLGVGKPISPEELEKFPTSRDAYKYLTEKLGIEREADPDIIDIAESASDLMVTGVPPPVALVIALGGKLSEGGAKRLGFGEKGQKIVQVAGEIGSAIATKGKSAIRAQTLPKGVKLTPQETMLITKGGERATSLGAKLAKPTKEAKTVVQSLESKLEESSKNIIGDAIEGYSSAGLKGADLAASKGYNLIRQEAKKFSKTIIFSWIAAPLASLIDRVAQYNDRGEDMLAKNRHYSWTVKLVSDCKTFYFFTVKFESCMKVGTKRNKNSLLLRFLNPIFKWLNS